MKLNKMKNPSNHFIWWVLYRFSGERGNRTSIIPIWSSVI